MMGCSFVFGVDAGYVNDTQGTHGDFKFMEVHLETQYFWDADRYL
jgi:hypothetical protein